MMPEILHAIRSALADVKDVHANSQVRRDTIRLNAAIAHLERAEERLARHEAEQAEHTTG